MVLRIITVKCCVFDVSFEHKTEKSPVTSIYSKNRIIIRILAQVTVAAMAANNVEAQAIKLGVRPEHITLEDSGVSATVDVSEMMGSSVHLHVTAVGQDVVIVVNTMNMTGAEVAALKMGKAVSFTFGGNNCHLFSKDTGINLEA